MVQVGREGPVAPVAGWAAEVRQGDRVSRATGIEHPKPLLTNRNVDSHLWPLKLALLRLWVSDVVLL